MNISFSLQYWERKAGLNTYYKGYEIMDLRLPEILPASCDKLVDVCNRPSSIPGKVTLVALSALAAIPIGLLTVGEFAVKAAVNFANREFRYGFASVGASLAALIATGTLIVVPLTAYICISKRNAFVQRQ